MKKLILGSSSPRRIEIIKKLGFTPTEIVSPNIDESPLKGELPALLTKRLAINKALAVAEKYPGEENVILSADTTVGKGRRILGKPKDAEEARKFITLLTGGRHNIYTTICVICGDQKKVRCVRSVVKFKNLSKQEIERFITSEEWKGKAGGYGIQGMASIFIIWMQGSYSGIVGLPEYETHHLLTSCGLNPN